MTEDERYNIAGEVIGRLIVNCLRRLAGCPALNKTQTASREVENNSDFLTTVENREQVLRDWLSRLRLRSEDDRTLVNKSFRVTAAEMQEIVGVKIRSIRDEHVPNEYVPHPGDDGTWDGFDVVEWIEWALGDISRRYAYAKWKNDPKRTAWNQ